MILFAPTSRNKKRITTWPTHQSEEVTAQVVASWVEQNDNPTFYQWAIVWKETMEPVGSISVVHWKEYISEAEVGYCIGRPWWHRGVMTECFSEVIRFLFLEVGANDQKTGAGSDMPPDTGWFSEFPSKRFCQIPRSKIPQSFVTGIFFMGTFPVSV